MAFHTRRDASRAKGGSATAQARQDKRLAMRVLPDSTLPLQGGDVPWWRAATAEGPVKVVGAPEAANTGPDA